MEAKATIKYVRLSPMKARRMVDLIRGRQVEEARRILRFAPQSASRTIEKALNSAVANAEQAPGVAAQRRRQGGKDQEAHCPHNADPGRPAVGSGPPPLERGTLVHPCPVDDQVLGRDPGRGWTRVPRSSGGGPEPTAGRP